MSSDCCLHIAVIEPSDLIYEGLSNLLLRSDIHFHVYRMEDMEEALDAYSREAFDILIANPVFMGSGQAVYRQIKKHMPRVHLIAVVYAFHEKRTLDLYDLVFQVTDTADSITRGIRKLQDNHVHCPDQSDPEELSQREKDILVELTRGLSNKEIADKLYISSHTVVSHRKNITRKTGIKSLSGLTIYAITKNIISLDDY